MPTDKASDWGDKRLRCAISTPAHWLTRPWCDYACLHCRRQGLDDNSRTTATCALRCWAEESKKNPNCACFLLTSRTEALRTHFDSTTWPRCDIFYKLLKIEVLPILLLVHGEIYLTKYFAGPPQKVDFCLHSLSEFCFDKTWLWRLLHLHTRPLSTLTLLQPTRTYSTTTASLYQRKQKRKGNRNYWNRVVLSHHILQEIVLLQFRILWLWRTKFRSSTFQIELIGRVQVESRTRR